MEILLCRHGETDTNAQGSTHMPGGDTAGLNNVGRQQALKLSNVAVEHNVRAVFSSPERRAIEAAKIAGQSLSLLPTIIPDLKERDWGDWNGNPWSVIEDRLKYKSLKERYMFVPPHGESWRHMERRLKFAIDKIAKTANGNVMIVTHGGALRAIVPILKHENLERSLGYHFDNVSVTSFLYSADEYKLVKQNDTSHL